MGRMTEGGSTKKKRKKTWKEQDKQDKVERQRCEQEDLEEKDKLVEKEDNQSKTRSKNN